MERLLLLLSWGDKGWGDELAAGAAVTIGLALATLPFGLALGLVIALMHRAKSSILRGIATLYTTIFRGLPELLTLYLVYFGLQIGLQKGWALLGLPGRIDMPAFVAGMIALGFVLAAFSSEVWVGALNSISRGQREGAFALGLSKSQTFRLVILPQLFRVALPGLGNNWMVLLKETSLVSVIALPDLMFWTGRANVVTKEPFLFFGVACLIYLVFSVSSAAGLSALERRFSRGFAAGGRR
jgi:polar amino acid transport system permease protein